MKFEQALTAMRGGKKARYEGETYFIDGESLVKYLEDDVYGFRDESVVVEATLYGDDIVSEDWEVIDE